MCSADCLLPGSAASIKAVIAQWVRALAQSVHTQDQQLPADSQSDNLDDVERTRGGDPEAYRRLIEHHQDHVARLLWRFSRDRRVHEELVQDVFVEAYLSLRGYNRKAPLAHWLARIATRVGYRYWKEQARRKQVEPLDVEKWDAAVGDGHAAAGLEPDEAGALLHQVLAQMSPRDRLVLTLRYLEECDVVETARRTGWTKTMVKVQTLRARDRLRKLIEQSGTELVL